MFRMLFMFRNLVQRAINSFSPRREIGEVQQPEIIPSAPEVVVPQLHLEGISNLQFHIPLEQKEQKEREEKASEIKPLKIGVFSNLKNVNEQCLFVIPTGKDLELKNSPIGLELLEKNSLDGAQNYKDYYNKDGIRIGSVSRLQEYHYNDMGETKTKSLSYACINVPDITPLNIESLKPQLEKCYQSILEKAEEYGIPSVVFPVFGENVSPDVARNIAIESIKKYFSKNPNSIIEVSLASEKLHLGAVMPKLQYRDKLFELLTISIEYKSTEEKLDAMRARCCEIERLIDELSQNGEEKDAIKLINENGDTFLNALILNPTFSGIPMDDKNYTFAQKIAEKLCNVCPEILNIKDKNGLTPLDKAKLNNNKDIITFLMKKQIENRFGLPIINITHDRNNNRINEISNLIINSIYEQNNDRRIIIDRRIHNRIHDAINRAITDGSFSYLMR